MDPFATVSSAIAAQVVVAVVGSGGLLGAVVAFLKLRPDVNTAAVTQAHAAAETMALSMREVGLDRDAWRTRALEAERECTKLREELERCQQAHGRRARDY